MNIRNFEHELCVSYICRLQYWQEGANDRLSNINGWLMNIVGKDNYIFGFEDYGQHGEWMLYTASKEDLLAFKLRWAYVN
jgi:hypothetical protein